MKCRNVWNQQTASTSPRRRAPLKVNVHVGERGRSGTETLRRRCPTSRNTSSGFCSAPLRCCGRSTRRPHSFSSTTGGGVRTGAGSIPAKPNCVSTTLNKSIAQLHATWAAARDINQAADFQRIHSTTVTVTFYWLGEGGVRSVSLASWPLRTGVIRSRRLSGSFVT